jgi:hypothetical protein
MDLALWRRGQEERWARNDNKHNCDQEGSHPSASAGPVVTIDAQMLVTAI